jgi:hypothetical protein
MIHGPITGGDHGWAFGRPLLDLAEHGYVDRVGWPEVTSASLALAARVAS